MDAGERTDAICMSRCIGSLPNARYQALQWLQLTYLGAAQSASLSVVANAAGLRDVSVFARVAWLIWLQSGDPR